jgi:probable F420-dependent oxidoreductase
VKVDAGLLASLDDVPARARAIEGAGYDGVFTFEGPHDPFFPLALAAEHTERLDLSTAIAVAFSRSPMTLAQIAYDLQALSQGRIILGLGSQIRPHIEKRFSMPWSHPAPRMRELVLAVRAIWSAWNDRTRLDFRGEFYRHTLMTPFFDPGPSAYGVPRVFLAGVGPAMTEVAGEVGDGFLVHPFSSERYMRETTWPALERGMARAGRSAEGYEVAWPMLVSVASGERQRDEGDVGLRARLAFYGSTPAYRPVLEAHGWGDVQTDLNRLSKEGRWDEMRTLIDDEMLDTFAIRCRPEDLPAKVHERSAGVVTRVSFDAPTLGPPEELADVVAAIRNIGATRAG